MKIGFQAVSESIQYYNMCSTAEATTLVAFNGGLILCVWKSLFGFYHPSKTALFFVDWCGRPASDHCPHNICWTSSTSPDSRSFRPSGGPWGIHFLNWWIVLGKASNGWGHSQNYWPKKILVLRSIIPRYGFSMMVIVDIQCLPNTVWSFLVSIWALITLEGLVGKGLFYHSNLKNPHVSTKQVLVLFKTCPTNSHLDPFQGNPMGKCT